MTTESPRPPGRPRNEGAEEAIANAVLQCFVEDGFAGMTVDRVAAAAGVGRATVYRRWPSKADMVIDAVQRRTFDHIETPDTGDLRADLEQLLTQTQRCMSTEHGILQRLQVEQALHPELGESLRSRVIAQRRAVMQELLQRGIERGELDPDTDLDLLGKAGPALIWQQLTLLGGPPDENLPSRIVNLLLPRPRS